MKSGSPITKPRAYGKHWLIDFVLDEMEISNMSPSELARLAKTSSTHIHYIRTEGYRGKDGGRVATMERLLDALGYKIQVVPK